MGSALMTKHVTNHFPEKYLYIRDELTEKSVLSVKFTSATVAIQVDKIKIQISIDRTRKHWIDIKTRKQ